MISLVPILYSYSVESKNAIKIALTHFVLTIRAVYRYGVAKMQEYGNFPHPYFLFFFLYDFNFLSQFIDLIKYYTEQKKKGILNLVLNYAFFI